MSERCPRCKSRDIDIEIIERNYDLADLTIYRYDCHSCNYRWREEDVRE